jgi:hypothetical protein
MTRKDIIESMGWMPSADNGMSDIIDRIERAVNQAVEAEREACAKVCEPQDRWDDPLTAWSIAQAIRARGSNGTPT